MIERHLAQLAAERGYAGGFEVAIGVEGGAELALKTMNPRLGILGGLSILGTSGIVRPFSCSAYIASIHQGIDVARANGVRHIAACTGNASEDAMRRRYGLPEIALIEMGDFAGAVLKHLRKAPVEKLSLCGGFGKISKLAGGHLDPHSRHSSIDLPQLAGWAAALGASAALQDCMRAANTSQQALAPGTRRRRGPGRCGLRPRPALRPRHRAHRGGAGSLRHRPPGQPGRPGLRGAPMKRLLLLGGIGEALALARRLGPAHLYSLAGLGKVPGDLACQVRVGGYGGAEGLAAFIDEQGFDLLVDATHPYAARISRNAVRAARLAGVPCWALRRPGWQAGPGDDWREVADWRELIAALAPFRRPLFTLGREPLEHLGQVPPHQHWTVRCLQGQLAAPRAEVIGARGPFSLDGERALFERLACDVLVSKNSGSQATEPKLQVAREMGLPVLVLARPALPPADREFADGEALLAAIRDWESA